MKKFTGQLDKFGTPINIGDLCAKYRLFSNVAGVVHDIYEVNRVNEVVDGNDTFVRIGTAHNKWNGNQVVVIGELPDGISIGDWVVFDDNWNMEKCKDHHLASKEEASTFRNACNKMNQELLFGKISENGQ